MTSGAFLGREHKFVFYKGCRYFWQVQEKEQKSPVCFKNPYAVTPLLEKHSSVPSQAYHFLLNQLHSEVSLKPHRYSEAKQTAGKWLRKAKAHIAQVNFNFYPDQHHLYFPYLVQDGSILIMLQSLLPRPQFGFKAKSVCCSPAV